MRYQVGTSSFTAAQQALARAPEIGVDKLLYVTSVQPVYLGLVELTGATAGTFTKASPFPTIPGTGYDLVAIAANRFEGGSAALTFEIPGQQQTPSAADATVTVAPPNFAGNQKFLMPQFAMFDLIPSTDSADKMSDLTEGALTGVTNGVAGSQWWVYALPDTADWVEVGCVDSANWNFPVPSSVAIACGTEPSAYTRQGRGEEGSLEVTAKYASNLDGLARYLGAEATVMQVTRKDLTLITERKVGFGWKPSAPLSSPEGNDAATIAATGVFSRGGIAV